MAEAGYNTTSHRRIVMNGNVVGTLSTGDGQILFPIPVSKAHIVAIVWALDVGGTTADGISLNINRVRAETDVLLVSAVDQIAHDAAVLYSTIRGTLQNNILTLGDIVRVDIDVAPTGAAGLAVALILHVDAD